VLDRGGQAMHLAMHASQHGPRVTKHVDELTLALERWAAPVWDSAVVLAREIDAVEAFAAGLRLLPQGEAEAARLGLAAPAELDWKIQHRWSRPRGTFHLEAMTEANGLGERLQILRRSLLPRHAWITYEHPWAQGGRVRVIVAYGLHLARAPVWAARAWIFTLRARRAGRRR
jgi:hypothetical protein